MLSRRFHSSMYECCLLDLFVGGKFQVYCKHKLVIPLRSTPVGILRTADTGYASTHLVPGRTRWAIHRGQQARRRPSGLIPTLSKQQYCRTAIRQVQERSAEEQCEVRESCNSISDCTRILLLQKEFAFSSEQMHIMCS